VAVFYGVSQCVAVSARADGRHTLLSKLHKLKAPCCSVCVAVFYGVLQYVAVSARANGRHTLLLKLHK